MKRVLPVLLLLSLSALAGTTLYKSVDKQGNVTFSDAPPADGSSAQQVEISSDNANVLPSEDVQEQIQQQQQADKQAADRESVARQDWQARYEKAQADLELAQRTLKDAKEIQEGDTVGSAFGGARPNAEWIERLEQAETDVELRQRELDSIKRERR